MTQKKKPGRRPLAPADRKAVIIATAVTTNENTAIEAAASLAGQTRADYMRRALLAAAWGTCTQGGKKPEKRRSRGGL